MSFTTDSKEGLLEAIAEFGTAATWTDARAWSYELDGVFNQVALAQEFRDAGILPGYEAAYLIDRAQLEGLMSSEGDPLPAGEQPAIDQQISVNGREYRIESIDEDDISLELRLTKP